MPPSSCARPALEQLDRKDQSQLDKRKRIGQNYGLRVLNQTVDQP